MQILHAVTLGDVRSVGFMQHLRDVDVPMHRVHEDDQVPALRGHSMQFVHGAQRR
jgi:hypothetical protein